jgi:TolA-binding protein
MMDTPVTFFRRMVTMKRNVAAVCIPIIGYVISTMAAAGGLPGQFLVSNQWRNLFSIHTPLTNPAFMTEEDYSSVRAVISLSPNDIANLGELGYIMPIGLRQAVGVSVVAENGRPVQNGYFTENRDFVATSSSTNNNGLFVVSYAANIWKQLSVGVNLKALYQGNFSNSTTEISGDIGVSYRLLRHPRYGSHLIGIMYQNPGTYALPGSAAAGNLVQQAGQQIKLAYHATFLKELLSADCQFDVADIKAQARSYTNQTMIPGFDLQCQIGYYPLSIVALKPYFGFSRNGMDFWGMGLGMQKIHLRNGCDAGFTYQYRNDISKGVAGAHSLYVLFDLGQNREDLHAKRVQQALNILANTLYNRAMSLYVNKKYWEAYQVFARIYKEFPKFHKIDDVVYRKGLCLESLDMRNVALDDFNETKTRFPLSRIVPDAQLAIMRVLYRRQKFDEVTDQFQEILSADALQIYTEMPDSLKNHAYYLMGQTLMKQHKNKEALDLLAKIPRTHPEYPFARQSMAIAAMITDNDQAAAVSFLCDAIIAQPATPAQQDLNNRSYLFLGYLHYEQDSLLKAVSSLRMVPVGCDYYKDALLGFGWSAIKAQQWNSCKTYGQQLATMDGSELLQAEGMLIRAHGHIGLKEYDEAATLLGAGQRKVYDYNPITEDSLSHKKDEYAIYRLDYDSLGQRFVELSGKPDSKEVVNLMDSLQGNQMQLKEKVDEYYRFTDLYNRSTLFNRTQPHLKENIEYALARIDFIKKEKAALADIEKTKKKLDDVQVEIDKAKEQLKMSTKGGGEK